MTDQATTTDDNSADTSAEFEPIESVQTETEAALDEAAKVLTKEEAAQVREFAKSGDVINAIAYMAHCLSS